jgi:Na+-translocating ferredoxin:NAD+ oxidoreductase RnfC subunit
MLILKNPGGIIMFRLKKGGLKFRLKGALLSEFSDIESEIKQIAFCLGKFKSNKDSLKKLDSVKKGDILIDNSDFTVLSPISGKVTVEGCKAIVTASGDNSVSAESSNLLKGDKVDALMKLGLLDRKDIAVVKRVFLNLTHTEPYMAKDDLLFEQFSESFVQGVSSLEDLFPGKEVIGVYSSEKVGKMLDELGLKSIKLEKYPFDNARLLACKFENKKAGDVNMDETLHVPAENLIIINDFLKKQIPPTYTYLSVAGNINSPKLVKVPLFSEINEIASKFTDSINDNEVVIGGVFSGRSSSEFGYLRRNETSMTILDKNKPRTLWGFNQPGFVEDSSTNTFVSSCLPFDKYNDNKMHGERRACVFCGYCESICPARLIPHVLYKHSDIDALEEAKQYRIMDCVDCGLCTYVCVSKIPIADKIAHGKEQIIKEKI